MANTFHRDGTLADGVWLLRGTWEHTGLRVGGAGTFAIPADDVERMVVPLDAGTVTVNGATLAGRTSVFDGPADVAYLGAGSAATITSDGRFAVAEARVAGAALPDAVIRAADVPVEHRGSGVAARTVRNFGTPAALAAQKLIVCEVVTPAGNWSSFPPHKHDEHIPGHESRLEELYWFEGRGLFAAGDLTELVRTGDLAVIPDGYHGPAAAPPSDDLYYLNVMAGPDPDRVWLITNDPDWEIS